jgi:cold shock CspA family protein
VSEFDEGQGRGVIESQGGARLSFHCTQLLDGTRTVDVGAEVRFDVVPGSNGAWEAGAVEKL